MISEACVNLQMSEEEDSTDFDEDRISALIRASSKTAGIFIL